MAAPKGNKFAQGLSHTGRPPIFESAELLSESISEYFRECKEDGTKATITGLALYLGFESRQSISDYATRNEEFSYIIKRAKLCVENSYELSGTAFDIFALKNMGWTDKQENEHTFTNVPSIIFKNFSDGD
jgi:hypothetical protein